MRWRRSRGSDEPLWKSPAGITAIAGLITAIATLAAVLWPSGISTPRPPTGEPQRTTDPPNPDATVVRVENGTTTDGLAERYRTELADALDDYEVTIETAFAPQVDGPSTIRLDPALEGSDLAYRVARVVEVPDALITADTSLRDQVVVVLGEDAGLMPIDWG